MILFPKTRLIGGVFTPPPYFVAEIHTETEDPGLWESRPAGPIVKFAAVSGDAESNVAAQAGQSLLCIDFGVEMVTPKANPAHRPMQKLPPTYYRKGYVSCEWAADSCSISMGAPKQVPATPSRICQHIWRVRLPMPFSP